MKKFAIALLLPLTLLFYSCEKTLPPSFEFTDQRDGHTYQYVQIGMQTWMSENLAYLPSVSTSSRGDKTIPNYYVYDYYGIDVSEAMAHQSYDEFGVLYNGKAAMTACPDGWHLPTDMEWKVLEKYLRMNSTDLDSDLCRNSGEVGKKLKSVSGWQPHSVIGDNSTGFNALPGGLRSSDGDFNYLGSYAYLWSSSEYSFSKTWFRRLYFNNDGVCRTCFDRSNSLSVRCIRDEE